MAGRIKDSDVAYVRDHSHIDEVVGDYVQLKNAGGGQKKGLCPFHDEKSPSFHVTPSKGFFHCFGCQTGGDVIAFLMKIDHLTFTESVERLAERIGYQLTYESNYNSNQSGNTITRNRLVAANTAAAEYYQSQLQLPNAQTARDFLQKRGFDKNVAADFGIGYAPDDWDLLYKELKKLSFTDQELNQAGLIKEGSKGFIDRYRNRLIWPIRDISGDVVGFGARKLASDDEDSG
ncbi:MAG: DNA primase, partial [Actinobacteria bacterium]|nr:DNA primase [Actinomycetota bacterium]